MEVAPDRVRARWRSLCCKELAHVPAGGWYGVAMRALGILTIAAFASASWMGTAHAACQDFAIASSCACKHEQSTQASYQRNCCCHVEQGSSSLPVVTPALPVTSLQPALATHLVVSDPSSLTPRFVADVMLPRTTGPPPDTLLTRTNRYRPRQASRATPGPGRRGAGEPPGGV